MSKVVVANYHINDVFKIPKGVDLEDKTQVKNWWVKNHLLHIYKTDGTKLTIDAEDGYDCDRPSDIVIEDAKDWGIDEEEEEQIIDCCKLCSQVCHTNDLCAHGVGAGRCCECQKCYDEMEKEEQEEE